MEHLMTASLGVSDPPEKLRELQFTLRFLQLKAANASADNRQFLIDLVMSTHADALVGAMLGPATLASPALHATAVRFPPHVHSVCPQPASPPPPPARLSRCAV